MQTRENAENVVFIQARVNSQVTRDVQFQYDRQESGQKTSNSQNQKGDEQKYKRADRNHSRGTRSRSHKPKIINANKTKGKEPDADQDGCRIVVYSKPSQKPGYQKYAVQSRRQKSSQS